METKANHILIAVLELLKEMDVSALECVKRECEKKLHRFWIKKIIL